MTKCVSAAVERYEAVPFRCVEPLYFGFYGSLRQCPARAAIFKVGHELADALPRRRRLSEARACPATTTRAALHHAQNPGKTATGKVASGAARARTMRKIQALSRPHACLLCPPPGWTTTKPRGSQATG